MMIKKEYIRTAVFYGKQVGTNAGGMFRVHNQYFMGRLIEAIIRYTKCEEGGKWFTWLKNNYPHKLRANKTKPKRRSKQ